MAEVPITIATVRTRAKAAMEERDRVKNKKGCLLENMIFP
jgi:hypothetical protein